MAVQVPTPEQVKAAATEVGLSLTNEDIQSYIELMKPNIHTYNLVDAMPDYLPIVRYPRTPGVFPLPEENTHNAWYVKTSIKGAAAGPLHGKRIAVKDNVMVAGVPMMNGCSILEGYVPEIDATVVQRILDAGGEIVGKVHCESYCISGGSHTGAKGPVHNPYKIGDETPFDLTKITAYNDWRYLMDNYGQIMAPGSSTANRGLRTTAQ